MRWRFTLLHGVPIALNMMLVAFALWQLFWVSDAQRDLGLRSFAAFYVVGGLVMVIAGVTAMSHLVFGEAGPRRLLYLSLVNMWIPTLLLLVLFMVR